MSYFCRLAISTEIGTIVIIADNCGLSRLCLMTRSQNDDFSFIEDGARAQLIIKETVKQLEEFFQKKRRCFDLPISVQGSIFQHRVWRLLQNIPYGKTASYSSLAEIIGDRNKARAVGGAAHANPLPIIIPCHRLIGKNGELTGFAGGMAMKKFLLQLEGYLSTG